MPSFRPKYLFIIIAFSLFYFQLFAQTENTTKNEIIEERIELIAQDLEESEIDFTVLFDDLYHFIDFPIDLNNTSREELEKLIFLNDFQILAILQYKRKNGGFASLYELKAIQGMDRRSIDFILPFVTVNAQEKRSLSLKKSLQYGKQLLILRHNRVLEEQLGFSDISEEELAQNPNRRFLGDPNQIYLRYRYSFRDKYSIGFTAEKDPGEAFFRGSNSNGFDFYSAHLMIQNIGIVKQAIFGDFQMQFGQGLTFWSGFGLRKNIQSPTEIRRFARGITPHTAINENQFLRGGAVTLEKGAIQASFFYSQKGVDANVTSNNADSLDDESLPTFTSLQISGLHRTPAEVANKNAIQERIAGSNVQFRYNTFRLGLTGVYIDYEGIFQRNLQLYNAFEFNDNQNIVLGADYAWSFNNVSLFGEVSRSKNGAIAQMHGAVVNVEDRLRFTTMFRDYPKDYQNVYANAFAEKSRPVNERGIYLGVDFAPIRKLLLTAFIDHYRFPWLSFQIDAPSEGYEFGSQLSYRPNRYFTIEFLTRYETRFRNRFESEEVIRSVVPRSLIQYRLQTTARVNNSVKLRNRIELRVAEDESRPTYNGYLLFQDIYYDSPNGKFSIRARYALFDVEGFDARIYAYENDLLYLFFVPMFNNRGTRKYFVFTYKPKPFININMKLARTTYSNINEVGSGLNLIDGNKRTDIRTQLIFKF